MQIEVDQSGKIEQLSHDTVLALTNDIEYTVILKKKEKRIIKAYLKKHKFKKFYSPTIFSVLLATVIFEKKIKKMILVDTEYPGYNNEIKLMVENMLNKLKFRDIPHIKFGFVGKESNSDYLASRVAKGRLKPNRILSATEVINLIFETKKSGKA